MKKFAPLKLSKHNQAKRTTLLLVVISVFLIGIFPLTTQALTITETHKSQSTTQITDPFSLQKTDYNLPLWLIKSRQKMMEKTTNQKKINERNNLSLAAKKNIKRHAKRHTSSHSKKKFARTTATWNIIIAPHPDDEILCCGARIRQDITAGERYKIIYITDGDAHVIQNFEQSKKYGQRRRQESITAMKRLGVQKNDLIWLNFPDSRLNQLKKNLTITSPYTGQNNSIADSYKPNTPYTNTGLKNILTDIFAEYPPKNIFVPSQNDTHPDHNWSGDFVQKIADDIGTKAKILQYTIHGRNDLQQSKPNKWKRSLIKIFRSQLHDENHKSYMYQLADVPEVFE